MRRSDDGAPGVGRTPGRPSRPGRAGDEPRELAAVRAGVRRLYAPVVVALSLTGESAPQRSGEASVHTDPGALARDLFREEITVAASTMGMLAAFMGVLGLLDAADADATFSTGPVGEALAILGLAVALAAVAAMADRHSSAEIRAVEAHVRERALVDLDQRLSREVGGTVPRAWGLHPGRTLRRPLARAAWVAGVLAVLVGAGAAWLRGPESAEEAVVVGAVTAAVLFGTALGASWISVRVLARVRGQHRELRRGIRVAAVPAVAWWLVWVVVWLVDVGVSTPDPTVRLTTWAAAAALVVPFPVWWWFAARHPGPHRRLVLVGMLTERVPALRETYSQALRVREHTGPRIYASQRGVRFA
ncbi:MAG: hypothetical protein GX593_10055 [Actinomycetales bacterium]|nr:hypothetical protein [Actinomycetales bacterium]